jgi:integrase
VGRKRLIEDWLPLRVYRGRTSYEFRPNNGGPIKLRKFKKDDNGILIENDQIKLEVLNAHASILNGASDRNVEWLIQSYFESKQFLQLAVNSQKLYTQLANKYLLPVFGQMEPKAVTPLHVRKFMDKLGDRVESTANRCHTVLSTVFGWGYERNIVTVNPVLGIKKHKEKPRSRYIEDWEFDLVYKIALESSYPWVAPMMEIAYLCRMRAIEVRSLTESDLLKEGLFVERRKDSMNEITKWSPRLRKAVSDAISLRKKVSTNCLLFVSSSSSSIPKTSFDSAWRRIRTKALDNGLSESFNFHDLKAKGVTDHTDKASGHRSKKMLAVYDRKPNLIDSTR